MLSNAYFLAKFRFDTAENEPAENLQNFVKIANFADPNPLTLQPGVPHADRLRGPSARAPGPERPARRAGQASAVDFGCIYNGD